MVSSRLIPGSWLAVRCRVGEDDRSLIRSFVDQVAVSACRVKLKGSEWVEGRVG
jgi:hypothetical protein